MDPLLAARAIWAKTDRDDPDRWLSLPQHLADTFDVAAWLWEHRLPHHVRARLARETGDLDSARAVATFLAGVHDVGKSSPSFEVQTLSRPGHEHLSERLRDAGLQISGTAGLDRKLARHDLVGQLVLNDWLQQTHGWGPDAARSLSSIVGGHHGRYPTRSALLNARSRTDLIGDGLWSTARVALLENLADRSGFAGLLIEHRELELDAASQVLLTGFTIMADWIASNESLFEYNPLAHELATRSTDALERLDLPPLWRPQEAPVDPHEHLRQRFELPEAAEARPVQRAALDLIERTDRPGLFIVEAGMGVGKTEAALLMAERLAGRLGLSGVYFALPSMSTSDAIFTRVLDWVDRLPDLAGSRTSVRLAHSKAALNDTYRGLLEHGRFRGIDDEHSAERPDVIAHSWFHGRKQAILADFAVGTIDQVLMAALQSRHVMLRHLGLAGKVVIIDECHAADEYMAVYLDRALEWLGALGTPVILLSATLPGRRRAAMVEAYDIGRGTARRRKPADAPSPYDPVGVDERYPLLTATTSGEPLRLAVETNEHLSTLTVHPLDDDLGSLSTLLDEKLSGGGCAVVIRNTVGRAQETFRHLREQFSGELTLAHSRFIATDRLRNDQELLRRFGPANSGASRPHRHVVVATQVIEQSLDIDFDLMVTDIAPVDLVLQRSGRLHRHDRERRPAAVSSAGIWITGVDWQSDVPEFDRGASAVYGDDALLRALAVLDVPTHPQLRMPHDISPLVQSAYAPEYPVPDEWRARASTAAVAAESARTKRLNAASAFLLEPPSQPNLNKWEWQTTGDWKSETKGRAAVRDGRESVEVIVVHRRADGELYRWGAPPDEPAIPIHAVPDPEHARLVAAATVALPPTLTYPGRIDRTIAELEARFFCEEWQGSAWLREQLIVVLNENCQCVLEDSILEYNDHTGLTAVPREDSGKDEHEH